MSSALRHRFRFALQALVLLAMLARGAIPAGFMPAPVAAHPGELFPLTICSGAGTSVIYVPGDKLPQKAPAHHEAPAHAPCVFSAQFTAGTLPVAPVVTALTVIAGAPDLPPPQIRASGGFAAPYASRAPPGFSGQD